MTAKEYLRQVYRLDNRIGSDVEELARLRSLASSLSSPALSGEPSPNRSTEAPFVRSVIKIAELEAKISAEIDQLVRLKDQVRSAIDTVRNKDERMVLRYRYIHNLTWLQISDELNADESTIRRWHSQALQHLEVPKKPVII